MPIYKMEGKKDGKQKYRVRINYTDSYGKPKQIDRVAYGKEEAKELERRLSNNISNETVSNITITQLYNEYISAQKYELRESTLDKTKKLLSTFIVSNLGDVRINKLTMPVLQQWKTEIQEQKTSRNKPFSLEYKRKIFSVFRTMLNYAVKMEYINKNPLAALGNFKDTCTIEKDINYYTSQEFLLFSKSAKKCAIDYEATLQNIYEWNFYVFFNIAFYTGLRKGEIYALRWTDVTENKINIKRSITQKLKGDDRETAPKNKSSIRTIQIPIPLQNILKEHHQRYSQITNFSNDWHICGGTDCVRDTTIDNRNSKYAELAGLKKIRIHDFRHSHASLLANNGINIQEIARRLGHSNVEVTWKIYAHLYPQEEERALDILNKIV